jgi:antitoxin component YwqK of YwqJK toxin-antitoxin module
MLSGCCGGGKPKKDKMKSTPTDHTNHPPSSTVIDPRRLRELSEQWKSARLRDIETCRGSPLYMSYDSKSNDVVTIDQYYSGMKGNLYLPKFIYQIKCELLPCLDFIYSSGCTLMYLANSNIIYHKTLKQFQLNNIDQIEKNSSGQLNNLNEVKILQGSEFNSDKRYDRISLAILLAKLITNDEKQLNSLNNTISLFTVLNQCLRGHPELEGILDELEDIIGEQSHKIARRLGQVNAYLTQLYCSESNIYYDMKAGEKRRLSSIPIYEDPKSKYNEEDREKSFKKRIDYVRGLTNNRDYWYFTVIREYKLFRDIAIISEEYKGFALEVYFKDGSKSLTHRDLLSFLTFLNQLSIFFSKAQIQTLTPITASNVLYDKTNFYFRGLASFFNNDKEGSNVLTENNFCNSVSCLLNQVLLNTRGVIFPPNNLQTILDSNAFDTTMKTFAAALAKTATTLKLLVEQFKIFKIDEYVKKTLNPSISRGSSMRSSIFSSKNSQTMNSATPKISPKPQDIEMLPPIFSAEPQKFSIPAKTQAPTKFPAITNTTADKSFFSPQPEASSNIPSDEQKITKEIRTTPIKLRESESVSIRTSQLDKSDQDVADETLSFPVEFHYRTLRTLNAILKSRQAPNWEYNQLKTLATAGKIVTIQKKQYLVEFNSKNGFLQYIGNYVNDSQAYNGYGIQFTKEEIYYGYWKNGVRDNQDIPDSVCELYYMQTREYYQGNFKNNKYHGQGTLAYGTGRSKFKGDWVDGQLEGAGEAVSETGTLYVGTFHNTLFEGAGKFMYSNGNPQSEGTFKEGKKNGKFRMYNYDGSYLREANFKDDVQVKAFQMKIKIIDETPDNPIDVTPKPAETTPTAVRPTIYSRKYGQIIYQDDLDRVQNTQWLNSKNISYYIGYLKEIQDKEFYDQGDNAYTISTGNRRRIYYFSDTMFSIFMADSSKFQYNDTVRLETKAYHTPGFLIFDVYDRLLFVVNLNNSHWCLVEMNTEAKDKYRFIRYDSMRAPSNYSQNDPLLKLLKQWAIEEVKDKCIANRENNGSVTNTQQYYLDRIENAEYTTANVPQQRNGIDCGVFTCGFMKDISEQKDDIEFNQDTVRGFRKFLTCLLKEEDPPVGILTSTTVTPLSDNGQPTKKSNIKILDVTNADSNPAPSSGQKKKEIRIVG